MGVSGIRIDAMEKILDKIMNCRPTIYFQRIRVELILQESEKCQYCHY